jgi:TonB family protein
MNEGWKSWEGQLVNGKFPLQRFLGGSERSGVFLTEESAVGTPLAAVKLVTAASIDADDQLRQWKVATHLDHPNVIRVFASGRCELGGTDFLYVLTEYAEEDLSQILPQRALTGEETRQVLDAALKGLAYIHAEGLVHGRVKPSNILATGDVVKLSSDSLRAAGGANRGNGGKNAYDAPETGTGALGPSADVWSLGVTLVEMLTQRLSVPDSAPGRQSTLLAGIPEPFQEIAQHCLQVDPRNRWTVAEIAARLRPGKAEPTSRQVLPSEAAAQVGIEAGARPLSDAGDGKKSAKWPYALAVVGALVVAGILIARPKAPAGTAQPDASDAGTSPSERREASTPALGDGSSTAAAVPNGSQPGQADFEGQVAKRVIPQISPGAMRSIRGKIRIQAKVNVDETGSVTQARLKGHVRSRYFARQVLEAARGWKFKPARVNGQPVASEWIVQFTLSRRAIDDSVVHVKP